jgi:predicted amidophosphoribosyltransferase
LSSLLVQTVGSTGERFDAVMAVPLHRDRLRERGYNQAGLLARQVSLALKVPDWSDLLIRPRATGRQSAQQSREERLSNLAGAFAWRDGSTPGTLSGKKAHILLLDDILTTGATLTAAASLLWQAGCQVTGLVVASNRQQ